MLSGNSQKELNNLLKTKTVNEFVVSLYSLTNDVNQKLKSRFNLNAMPENVEGGAGDLAEILEVELEKAGFCRKKSIDLHQHLQRLHIAHIYLLAKLDNEENELDRSCVATVTMLKCQIIEILNVRRFYSQLNVDQFTQQITGQLEREYDDFKLVLKDSSEENKKKICSIDIKKVADISRCITLTEMVPINSLTTAINQFCYFSIANLS